mgnify:CR=1 FL=1
MKKFLSIILTAVFILSIFSFNSFAAETTKLNKWSEENFDPENGLSVKVYTVLQNNSFVVITQEAHIKDNIMAFTSKINNIDVKFILSSDTLWLYSPTIPFLHIKSPVEGFDFNELVTPDFSEEIKFLKNYETDLNSNSYFVEEFLCKNEDNEELVIKFYFIEDELVFIDIPNNIDGYDTVIRMEILSNNVDDKVFEVPFFSINIYPLIMFFYNVFNII